MRFLRIGALLQHPSLTQQVFGDFDFGFHVLLNALAPSGYLLVYRSIHNYEIFAMWNNRQEK
jgi:hypothetical protein